MQKELKKNLTLFFWPKPGGAYEMSENELFPVSWAAWLQDADSQVDSNPWN